MRNLRKENLLTQDLLKELFSYKKGVLYRKVAPKNPYLIGKEAGCLNPDGYCKIVLNGKAYMRSRLVFFMHKGFWPEEVDHINCIKNDDRVENLRDSTHSKNQKNTKTWGKIPFRYIVKENCNYCKQGFFFRFMILGKGIKKSINLEKLIVFRNEWLKKHDPERLGLCKKFNE